MNEPKLINGGLAVDDRGMLSFVNDFDFKDVKRFYMVENHEQGFIRAWHGHAKEAKYVYVVSGAIKLALVPLQTGITISIIQKTEVILSALKPQVFYIPPGYYNGFMTLQENTKIIFFSTSTLEESKGDDIRQEFNHFGEDVWKIIKR